MSLTIMRPLMNFTLGEHDVRRAIATIVGLTATIWLTGVHAADIRLQSVYVGANDVVALAKFYDAAFGFKEVIRYGEQPLGIIMRPGATVAAAKASSGAEIVVDRREPGAAKEPVHIVLSVSDINATMATATAAGAKIKDKVFLDTIAGLSVKLSMLIDPEGNRVELMELPTGVDYLSEK